MRAKKPTSKNATRKPKATGTKASRVAIDPERLKKVAGGSGGKMWGWW